MSSFRMIVTVVFGCLICMGGCGESPPIGPGGAGGMGGSGGTPGPSANPEAAAINKYFAALPDWDNTEPVAEDDEILDANLIKLDGKTPYKCRTVRKNQVQSLGKIIAVGTNQGRMWPGALVQGNSLESGNLELIDVDRAPITINVDLPIPNTSRVLDDPNSVTAQQAIAEMQIEAGALDEGSQAGAGTINFQIEEATSFEQSMLSLGISGGFTEPQSQVGLEASTSVSTERSVKTHTVVANFVQEKFTVRIADDLISTPVGFFADDVGLQDIEGLESTGVLGSDNIPMYIESVTYGRILLFSMESTQVENVEKLSVALDVSMADYLSAGTTLDETQRTILMNSTKTIYSAGGSEEGANAAVRGLDWSKFFVPAPVSTTVPIAFTLRTINGKKQVKLVNNIMFDVRERCDAPVSYNIQVILESATLTKGLCAGCVYASRIQEDGQLLPNPLAAGSIVGVWGGPQFGPGRHTMAGKGVGTSVKIISGWCGLLTGALGCTVGAYVRQKETMYTFPYENLQPNGNRFTHDVLNTLRTVRFSYIVGKTANYQ